MSTITSFIEQRYAHALCTCDGNGVTLCDNNIYNRGHQMYTYINPLYLVYTVSIHTVYCIRVHVMIMCSAYKVLLMQ